MEFKTASVISTGLHAAVLLWALVSFSGKTFEVTPAESLPVDLMSEKDFTAMTKGSKTAPKAEVPKPLVEKIAEPKPAETSATKITEKKEIQPTADKPPEPKPPEKKEAKAETKPEPPKPEETKPDPIAEKLKKPDEPKKQTTTEQKKPDKPEKKQPKFDADKIMALLDKRDPTRNAATGDTLNNKPSLGHVNGASATLSMSEIDAFKNRMRQCWNPPIGMDRAQEMVVLFRVQFNLDGSVKTGPDIVGGKPDPSGPAFAESARRALLQCQPYTMFHKETYAQWNDMEVGFNSKEMFRD